MAFPVALAIGAGLEIGLPLLKRLFGSEKRNKWFDLAEQAGQGVVGAIEAWQSVKAFEDSGHTPTDAELDDILEKSRALHDQIQATGD